MCYTALGALLVLCLLGAPGVPLPSAQAQELVNVEFKAEQWPYFKDTTLLKYYGAAWNAEGHFAEFNDKDTEGSTGWIELPQKVYIRDGFRTTFKVEILTVGTVSDYSFGQSLAFYFSPNSQPVSKSAYGGIYDNPPQFRNTNTGAFVMHSAPNSDIAASKNGYLSLFQPSSAGIIPTSDLLQDNRPVRGVPGTFHTVTMWVDSTPTLNVEWDNSLVGHIPWNSIKESFTTNGGPWDGYAYIGFVARSGTISTNHPNATHRLIDWTFKNYPAPIKTAYQERLVFRSHNRSLYTGTQDGSKFNWTKNLFDTASGNKVYPDTQKTATLFPLPDNKGVFGGIFGAQTNVTAKMWVEAGGDGGSANIEYPALLSLTLPDQFSLFPGDSVDIGAQLNGLGATMTTTDPRAHFKAMLNLRGTPFARIKTSPILAGEELWNNPLVNLSDPREFRITFLDTDFLLSEDGQNLLQWAGLPFNIADPKSSRKASFAVQDDEAALPKDRLPKGGAKPGRRGSPGDGGTSRGSKKGASPLNYITGEFKLPDLARTIVNGRNDENPNAIEGSAIDGRILNFHADITSALVGAIPEIGPLLAVSLNSDVDYPLGTWGGNSLGNLAYGWHVADLYGDLNLGIKQDYLLTPQFQLKFRVLNQDYTATDLDATGKKPKIVTQGQIRMPTNGDPLVIVPILTLTQAELKTSVNLTIGGLLEYNPLSAYFELPNIFGLNGYSQGAGLPVQTLINTFDPNSPFSPALIKLMELNNPVSFADTNPNDGVEDIDVVYGRPITIYPVTFNAPVLDSGAPTNTFRNEEKEIVLTGRFLTLNNAPNSCRVVWDAGTANEVILPILSASSTSVRVNLPALQKRTFGSHTLTLQTMVGNAVQKTSNALPYAIKQAVPLAAASFLPLVLGNASPNLITGPMPRTMDGTPAAFPFDPTLADSPRYINLYVGVTHDLFDPEQVVLIWPRVSDTGSEEVAIPLYQNNPPQSGAPQTLVFRVPASLVEKAATLPVRVRFKPKTTLPDDGGEANAGILNILNPVPQLFNLGKSLVYSGVTEYDATLNGQDFMPETQGYWNGKPRPTRYVSSSVIQVLLNAQDLSVARRGTLSAFTPGPGGGLSTSQELTIGTSKRAVLRFTPTLSRGTNGEVELKLNITNATNELAAGLQIGNIELRIGDAVFRVTGGVLPISLGDLGGNQSTSVTGRFANMGAAKTSATLTINGTYSNGPFTTTLRVTIP